MHEINMTSNSSKDNTLETLVKNVSKEIHRSKRYDYKIDVLKSSQMQVKSDPSLIYVRAAYTLPNGNEKAAIISVKISSINNETIREITSDISNNLDKAYEKAQEDNNAR